MRTVLCLSIWFVLITQFAGAKPIVPPIEPLVRLPGTEVGLAIDVDYQQAVKPILTKYCVGCHNEKDNESEVQLQSLANIFKGGPKGAIVIAKEPSESILLKAMLGTIELKMPPEDSHSRPQLRSLLSKDGLNKVQGETTNHCRSSQE